MKLEQLRTFLAVLDYQSFSRAAEHLGLSQSTVSFHVTSLEEALGARLLERQRGAVRVTEQGGLLVGYARQMLAMADEAVVRLQRSHAAPAGRLALAASTIVAEYLLPPILARFRQAYPNVGVRVAVSSSRAALEALRSERCELALVGKPANERSFESAVFAQDDIVLVGPSNGVRRVRDARELAKLPLILREVGSGTRAAVAEWLGAADVDRADVIEVGSTQATRACVMEGLGYGFISRCAVADDVRARRMRIVGLDGTPLCRAFFAVQLRARTPTAAARALLDVIAEQRD